MIMTVVALEMTMLMFLRVVTAQMEIAHMEIAQTRQQPIKLQKLSIVVNVKLHAVMVHPTLACL